jgi:anaphase-promoting complex subunit 5
LSKLEPDSATDPELALVLNEARVEALFYRGQHREAFKFIQDLDKEQRGTHPDILHCLSTLVLKATLYARIGKPEKCFSIALRAASISFKARLMPYLWNAIALLCNIMNEIDEYWASSRLLDAVIPQVSVL